jgi:hypothetical protein
MAETGKGVPRRGRVSFEERAEQTRRGADGLTDLERKICLAVDQGLSDRQTFREVRPLSTASDRQALDYIRGIRRRPHCAAYLAELKAKTMDRHLDKKDRLVEELAAVAFANLGDFLTSGPDGLAIKPFDDLSPAQYRALAAITITRTAQGGSVRLAMHDKLSALHKLCKLFGLYEKPPAPAGGEAPVALSDVERAQRLAALLRPAADGA